MAPSSTEGAAPGAVDLLSACRRWREAGLTQRDALQATTAEIEATVAFVEQSVIALGDRFCALADHASAQSARVEPLLATTDRIVTPEESVSMTDLVNLLEGTLAQVVDRVLSMSKSAVSMAYALNDVSDSVRRIGDFTGELDQINRQTRMLAFNATIEAARVGQAGAGFAVVAHEVKLLSAQTAQLSDAMRSEAQTVGAAVQHGLAVVNEVANVDLTDNLATRQRLKGLLAALLNRREEVDKVIRDAARGSADISGQISAIVGAFQFQDRSKQRFTQVTEILRAMESLRQEAEATTPLGAVAPDIASDRAWLERLADGFTMQEVADRFRATLLLPARPAGAALKAAYDAAEGEVELW